MSLDIVITHFHDSFKDTVMFGWDDGESSWNGLMTICSKVVQSTGEQASIGTYLQTDYFRTSQMI
jgi:hypothetical protein